MNNSLRQQYLTAIGIQSWQLNTTLEDDLVEPEIIQEDHPHKTDNKLIKNSPGQADSEKHPSIAVKADISANKNTHNEQIISSQKESYNNPLDDLIADKELIETKIIDPAELQPDSELDNSIHLCKKCPSRSTRLNALAGQGYSNASVFFVSGAPDAEEDRQGEYLTSQSKSLFNSMIRSIGYENDYYFTGIIKCYSMDNFRFNEQEIQNCTPYLYSQIEKIKPSVICVLGAAQAQLLLDTKQSFNELRGKIHHISVNNNDYAVIVTYHPAYLLRNPLYKKESLKDLIMVKSLLK